MLNQHFVAEHRGGPLKKEHHKQLMRWACACTEHLLPLLGENIDESISFALATAKAWINDEVKCQFKLRVRDSDECIIIKTNEVFFTG